MNLGASNFEVYSRLRNWQQEHERNMQEAIFGMRSSSLDKDSIYNSYKAKEEQIGAFDFMEGNDSKVADEYDVQIKKLAQADFDEKDTNKDGVVSWEEYRDSELSDLTANDSDNTKAQAKTIAYLLFALMDQGMGNSDSNGTLSVKEFESLYKNLDRFNGNGLDEEGDGIISTEAFGMASWLIDNIFSDSTVNRVSKLAFRGYI